MEKICEPHNLVRALSRVVSNGGSPGVDGMMVEDLRDQFSHRLPTLRETLLSGKYRPEAVKRVEIPKPRGGTRRLGIPTVQDRLVQQAILQILQPMWDPTFSEGSYGFRPGRSAHDAIRQAEEYVESGLRTIVSLDLEKFFDQVNHDRLMHSIGQRVGDKRLLRLIGSFLRSGVLENGLVSPTVEGTPQGGPLSPLLSNIVLDELDKELERRGHAFVRYADDVTIFVGSERAGQRVLASLSRYVESRLKLRVNEDKSGINDPGSCELLGFTMAPGKKGAATPSPASLDRLMYRLRRLTNRSRGRPIARVIAELSTYLRGWVGYFGINRLPAALRPVDGWLRRRLRCYLWVQWRTNRRRFTELVRRGIRRRRARKACGGHSGPWHMSSHRTLHSALPNGSFAQMGLPSIEDLWARA